MHKLWFIWTRTAYPAFGESNRIITASILWRVHHFFCVSLLRWCDYRRYYLSGYLIFSRICNGFSPRKTLFSFFSLVLFVWFEHLAPSENVKHDRTDQFWRFSIYLLQFVIFESNGREDAKSVNFQIKIVQSIRFHVFWLLSAHTFALVFLSFLFSLILIWYLFNSSSFKCH